MTHVWAVALIFVSAACACLGAIALAVVLGDWLIRWRWHRDHDGLGGCGPCGCELTARPGDEP